VTICNLYGFGYLEEQKHAWLEFASNVSAKQDQWPYDRMASILSDLTEDEYEYTWESLQYPTSYISSMNMSQAYGLMTSQQLIVDCVLAGAYSIPCSDVTHFKWDPFYHGCYTIHVPESVTQVSLFDFMRQKQNVINKESCQLSAHAICGSPHYNRNSSSQS